MLFRFREMKEQAGPIQQEDTVELEGLEKEHPDLVQLGPVEVTVTAWEDQGLYHLQGKQSARATLRCSRCLTTHEETLSADWHEVFTDDKDRLEASDEEDEIHPVSLDQPTDLTPYIREALVLSLPFAPVCREDCKGLCPTCGINWNQESCQCDNRRVDPRLAKLEELLKRDD
ncbi:uncharacterized protein C8P63_10742 [Melghirimyces profundicolus]|uniref:DUF177 domain-containing protein n=1 Tax=Melghirimyces profundicolus TaxID=1242148 RepID=A0A2T6BZ48_9BACL|nr:YceD family protein [Melghirimyces profundicolus]PTX61247.1 uncharacterized protein C8P63_10742 [Melghirimyces profundicolus]